MGGLVAFGAYKMSTRDAERVEQHTGVEPEELTDEELATAMDELGIEKENVTDADREEGSAAPATAPTAAPDPTGGGQPDYLEELQKLSDLHQAGVLTDEEFNEKKRQVLDL